MQNIDKNYYTMLKSRIFEEEIQSLFEQNQLHGTTHLNIGQEASHVGLCLALDKEDWIVPTHRTHGFNIAKGSSLYAMFSEMYGSRHGLCKGLGGSMHMSDKSTCNLGSSAVVGSGIGLATGLSFALKRQNKDNIAVAIFGDGATSRGMLYECMNLASIWSLPLLFFLENNLYGMSASSAKMIAGNDISSRAVGFNIHRIKVDGNDFDEVFKAIRKAREIILKENRPVFVEVITYRQCGHSKSDSLKYRDKEEELSWAKKDPLILYSSKYKFSEEKKEKLYKDALKEVKNALSKAQETKDDILSIEELNSFVYKENDEIKIKDEVDHEISYKEAIYEALDTILTQDDRATFIGEDIGLYGGCFGLSKDLYKKHPDKLFETPVSEEAFSSLCVGAAALKERVIAEIMYGDFVTLSSDAVINHGAKMYFMSAGQFSSSFVLRCPIGAGTGHGAQHTQSLENMFLNIPGLKIVSPSDSTSAKRLLIEAHYDNNPVLFLEHKDLYNVKSLVTNEKIKLGKARVLRKGNDLTIIAYSRAVKRVQDALLNTTYSVDLIDLSTIKPLDFDTIKNSILKTKRVLIVEDNPIYGSVGSSVIAMIAKNEECILKSSIAHIGAKDNPIPFSKILEESSFVTSEEIIKEINKIIF